MTDNVHIEQAQPGGPIIATDYIAGTHYPRSKIVLGADNVNDGDVCAANPLPAEPPVLSPQLKYVKVTSLAAGGTADLDSAQISTGRKGKLLRVRVASSVAFKVSLYTVSNGVASPMPADEGYGWFGEYEFCTPHPDFVTVSHQDGVGFDGFRVTVVNLDVSLPADISVSFAWDEVNG